MQILTVLYALACIFGAAIVRGYSGFGFSLLAVVSLSLLLPPTEIVPSIFMMEVVASLHLLPGVWRDIHWRALFWLAVGSLVGTPFGVYALAHVPAAPMTLALSVFVLIAAILLAGGYALKSMPGRAATFTTGTAIRPLQWQFRHRWSARDLVFLLFARRRGSGPRLDDRLFPDDRCCRTCLAGLERTARSGDALARLVLSAGVGCRRVAGQSRLPEADPVDFRRWVLRLLMLLAVLTGGRALTQIL